MIFTSRSLSHFHSDDRRREKNPHQSWSMKRGKVAVFKYTQNIRFFLTSPVLPELFYQSLTNVEEGKYPPLVSSSLRISPKRGEKQSGKHLEGQSPRGTGVLQDWDLIRWWRTRLLPQHLPAPLWLQAAIRKWSSAAANTMHLSWYC